MSGYTWEESEEEVEVRLPLPAGSTKQDVRCEIGAASLELSVGGGAPLLSGKLCGRVFPDGSAWCFEQDEDAGPLLTLTLAKRAPDNRLWGYVMLADLESQAEEPAAARPPPDQFEVKPGETKAW